MKSFVDFLEEEMTTTSDVAMPPDMKPRKKRKTNILTRNFIEVAGKRKRLSK